MERAVYYDMAWRPGDGAKEARRVLVGSGDAGTVQVQGTGLEIRILGDRDERIEFDLQSLTRDRTGRCWTWSPGGCSCAGMAVWHNSIPKRSGELPPEFRHFGGPDGKRYVAQLTAHFEAWVRQGLLPEAAPWLTDNDKARKAYADTCRASIQHQRTVVDYFNRYQKHQMQQNPALTYQVWIPRIPAVLMDPEVAIKQLHDYDFNALMVMGALYDQDGLIFRQAAEAASGRAAVRGKRDDGNGTRHAVHAHQIDDAASERTAYRRESGGAAADVGNAGL